MSLTKRLERLEAYARARSPNDFWVCRELIYDPREWDISEEDAVAKMQADELDRLVAAGEIRESDRERVNFIVSIIVYPPERPNDPLWKRSEAA